MARKSEKLTDWQVLALERAIEIAMETEVFEQHSMKALKDLISNADQITVRRNCHD